MLVRDVMSSPAVTARPDDDLAQATRVLDRLNLTSLPVVGPDGRLLGIVTEADVIGRLTRHHDGDPAAHRRDGPARVRDVMTHEVLTAQADDDLAHVVALMNGTTLKSLPVVLHDRVVGMVSRRDVVRGMARGDLHTHPEGERPAP